MWQATVHTRPQPPSSHLSVPPSAVCFITIKNLCKTKSIRRICFMLCAHRGALVTIRLVTISECERYLNPFSLSTPLVSVTCGDAICSAVAPPTLRLFTASSATRNCQRGRGRCQLHFGIWRSEAPVCLSAAATRSTDKVNHITKLWKGLTILLEPCVIISRCSLALIPLWVSPKLVCSSVGNYSTQGIKSWFLLKLYFYSKYIKVLSLTSKEVRKYATALFNITKTHPTESVKVANYH